MTAEIDIHQYEKRYKDSLARGEGKKTYNDRKAVADFYRLLKRNSNEHSVEYVIRNLPAIAVDFIKAKHERKKQR